jgi:ABC-type nitrate/sulfonate/bicarbonate transport system substrate-binding protein
LDGLVAGIRDGSLDAASLWEPQLSELSRALPGQLAYFYGNGLYTFSWNLVGLPSTLAARRSDIEKLLRVLNEAAEFIEREPQAAKEHLEGLGERGADFAHVLGQANYRPVLSQDLLVQLEAESRWVLARDGKGERIPNYLRFLDSSFLQEVIPSAVTIIK